jgi:hypothetical protein
MASTVLVLIVIPSMYTILGDLGRVSEIEKLHRPQQPDGRIAGTRVRPEPKGHEE